MPGRAERCGRRKRSGAANTRCAGTYYVIRYKLRARTWHAERTARCTRYGGVEISRNPLSGVGNTYTWATVFYYIRNAPRRAMRRILYEPLPDGFGSNTAAAAADEKTFTKKCAAFGVRTFFAWSGSRFRFERDSSAETRTRGLVEPFVRSKRSGKTKKKNEVKIEIAQLGVRFRNCIYRLSTRAVISILQ